MSCVLLIDEVRLFLESGVAAMVGTRDAELIPEMTRGWGPHAAVEGTVEVCIALAAGRKTLENLSNNGQIVLTLASPVNYKQVQIKGCCVQVEEPGEADLARVEGHREDFIRACEMIGTPRFWIEKLYRQDVSDPPVLIKISNSSIRLPGRALVGLYESGLSFRRSSREHRIML
jgi:hypothetical protein